MAAAAKENLGLMNKCKVSNPVYLAQVYIFDCHGHHHVVVAQATARANGAAEKMYGENGHVGQHPWPATIGVSLTLG